MVGEKTLENMQSLSDYSEQSNLHDALLVMVFVCADAINSALVGLHDGSAEPEILEVLNNLDAIGKRAGANVVKTVALLVEDSRQSVRHAAIKTLLKIAVRGDKDAMKSLSESLKEPNTRDAIVTSLKLIVEVGDEDTIFDMISYFRSHSERVSGVDRETVVTFNDRWEWDSYNGEAKIQRALARSGYEPEKLTEYTFSASLLRCNRHGLLDQDFYWEGEWRVGRFSVPWHMHVNHTAFPLTLILSVQDNNAEVCLAAMDVLGHVAGKGNQSAIGAIASCLEDENNDVQWKAVEQLGLVIAAGDRSGIMHAKKRLTHEDRRVRWAAQEALGQFIERST